jgi:hypothetical protein
MTGRQQFAVYRDLEFVIALGHRPWLGEGNLGVLTLKLQQTSNMPGPLNSQLMRPSPP